MSLPRVAVIGVGAIKPIGESDEYGDREIHVGDRGRQSACNVFANYWQEQLNDTPSYNFVIMPVV